jgi:hypothetical protein
MARINDEAQWIVLIGFIVAVSLFFLATIINESTLVGQSTSEAVLDFSKADIQDVNQKTKDIAMYPLLDATHTPDITDPNRNITTDIEKLYSVKKSAIISITITNPAIRDSDVTLHYNDGIINFTAYNEEE